jgi:hypothetical protein
MAIEILVDTDYAKRGFTKNICIAAMYEGMYQGIKAYKRDTHALLEGTCCIILNNWRHSTHSILKDLLDTLVVLRLFSSHS